LQGLALTFVTSVVTSTHYGAHPWKESVSLSSSISGYFLAGVYASLITYRLFFNPMNKFPGPYFARLSTFDLVFRISKFDTNKYLHHLHQKHGKFVRI
jgi:tryprostatin B 6-hydroxylase